MIITKRNRILLRQRAFKIFQKSLSRNQFLHAVGLTLKIKIVKAVDLY